MEGIKTMTATERRLAELEHMLDLLPPCCNIQPEVRIIQGQYPLSFDYRLVCSSCRRHTLNMPYAADARAEWLDGKVFAQGEHEDELGYCFREDI